MNWLIRVLHNWFGLFPHLMKDPYVALFNAHWYLEAEIRGSASYRARGFMLPEQIDALDLLLALRRQLPLYCEKWVREE